MRMIRIGTLLESLVFQEISTHFVKNYHPYQGSAQLAAQVKVSHP